MFADIYRSNIMLNRSTLTGRQTRMSTRRVVGANLVPTLVRLAECADLDLCHPARAVVVAVYGDKLAARTSEALADLTPDELETMLDVMHVRAVEVAATPGYLALYLGPFSPVPATNLYAHAPRVLMGERRLADGMTGLEALAGIRDGEAGTSGAEVAGRVLRLDLLGRLSPAVRAFILKASSAVLRGLCDEIAEHDVPDTLLMRLLEATCR
jgi:hypothetical protein